MEHPTLHENKLHGKITFPYIVYRGNIPEYISSYPLHWHDEMEIIYVVSGTGYVTADTCRYLLHPGDIVLLPPQIVHSIEQFEETSMEYFNILFHFSLLRDSAGDSCFEKYLRPLFEHQITLPLYLQSTKEPALLLKPYLEDLISNRSQSYTGYELMVKSNLFAIMHLLNKYSSPADEENRSIRNASDRLKKVLLYIRENYDQEISVQTAASVCGFSESHFMKLFRLLTGSSFTQYLKNYRLEIAAQQLLKGDQKITEISQNTGFHNLSYFTRSFTEKYGMTPKKYQTGVK